MPVGRTLGHEHLKWSAADSWTLWFPEKVKVVTKVLNQSVPGQRRAVVLIRCLGSSNADTVLLEVSVLEEDEYPATVSQESECGQTPETILRSQRHLQGARLVSVYTNRCRRDELFDDSRRLGQTTARLGLPATLRTVEDLTEFHNSGLLLGRTAMEEAAARFIEPIRHGGSTQDKLRQARAFVHKGSEGMVVVVLEMEQRDKVLCRGN